MPEELKIHDRRVASVIDAVAKLSALPIMTPEAVFEGAIKAAAIVMLSASDRSITDVATMIRNIADALEAVEPPKLTLVRQGTADAT